MTSRNRRELFSRFWSKQPEWSAVQGPGDTATGESRWILASRQAMGTYFEIRMAAHTLMAVALAEKCFNLIDDLEMQMTIYRDDSAMARLNATYHQNPVKVDPRLYELLSFSRAIHLATHGAYDITTGALSRAWGFVHGPKKVPSPEQLKAARQITGMRHLIFNDSQHSIQSTLKGVEINLGSIGKGYAIDRVVDVIRQHPWPTTAIVHGGRSSLYALGHQVGTLFEPWRIALHNPLDPSQPLVELMLMDQAVGTSGGSFQSFVDGGRVYGHIIDPRSGIPPVGPLSVSVVAPTAAEADALSTAFYLTGPKLAWDLIRNRPEVGAVFLRQKPDSESPEPELLVLNLSPQKVLSKIKGSEFVALGQELPAYWTSEAS